MTTTQTTQEAFEAFFTQSRPVFLFGNNRAGTTLLHNMANLHPDAFKLAKNSNFVEHIWRYRRIVTKKVQQKLFRATLLRVGFPGEEDVPLYKNCNWLFGRLQERMKPAELFSCLAFAEHQLWGEGEQTPQLWLEKTNSHVFHYRKLKSWFPEAKFVCVVRNPLANAASAFKVAEKRNQSNNRDRTVASKAIAWVMYNTFIMDMVRHFPQDCHLLQYEDLVTSPVEEILKVYEFLDLCPVPEDKLQTEIENFGNYKPSNIGVQRSKGVDNSSMERWREILTPEQVEVVRQITGPLAQHFGYSLEDAPSAPAGKLGRLQGESWKLLAHRKLWQALHAARLWKPVRPLLHWQ